MSDNSSMPRAFYCQEWLWQAFADLANQRLTTVDALINEAMALYVQPGGHGIGMPPPSLERQPLERQPYHAPSAATPSSFPPGQSRAPANFHQQQHATPPHPTAAPLHPHVPNPSQLGSRLPPPTPANQGGYRRPPSIFDEVNAPVPTAPGAQPLVLASLNAPQTPHHAPAAAAHPMAKSQAPFAQPPTAQPLLYIVFANQRYVVNKDKYIIGRSSQLADLVIRDGNISRKHCAVIYKSGAYYMKDLDSTNGIEYRGNRIDSKRIEEGDQFNICEFYFTFTYKPA